jgi:putative spermidine/putrescine transport system substrate-binding protein/spermidine/putrescine transport system substrate-binding protein
MDELARRELSRRRFLRNSAVVGLGAVGAGALAACGGGTPSAAPTTAAPATAAPATAGTTAAPASASPTAGLPDLTGVTLNALVWEGYTDDSFVKPFEDATGAKVNSTFIGSNDELVAKLRGGGAAQYDIMTPSCDTDRIVIDAGLALPLDQAKIPNWATAYPAFKTADAVVKDGKLYGVPMCWGVIPIIVDLEKIPDPASTWGILWDPQYSGKISVWNDISTIWSTGLLLGFPDVYNLSDAQLQQIKAKLVEQKPLVRKYWSTAGELTNLFASGEIAAANSFGGLTYTQLTGQGKKMREFVPKEGATAWVDYWLVSAETKNADAAMAFLNYIHDPKTQSLIYAATGYGPTNQNVVPLVDQATIDLYHLSDPTYMDGLSLWQAVPERAKYLDILNSVLSA